MYNYILVYRNSFKQNVLDSEMEESDNLDVLIGLRLLAGILKDHFDERELEMHPFGRYEDKSRSNVRFQGELSLDRLVEEFTNLFYSSKNPAFWGGTANLTPSGSYVLEKIGKRLTKTAGAPIEKARAYIFSHLSLLKKSSISNSKLCSFFDGLARVAEMGIQAIDTGFDYNKYCDVCREQIY